METLGIYGRYVDAEYVEQVKRMSNDIHFDEIGVLTVRRFLLWYDSRNKDQCV